MTTPDLLTDLADALEAIEREARTGRLRITSGFAPNGSSALQRCCEEARDARARLLEHQAKVAEVERA